MNAEAQIMQRELLQPGENRVQSSSIAAVMQRFVWLQPRLLQQ